MFVTFCAIQYLVSMVPCRLYLTLLHTFSGFQGTHGETEKAYKTCHDKINILLEYLVAHTNSQRFSNKTCILQ